MKIQRPLPNRVIQPREQCLPLHIGLIPIREGHRSLLVLRSSAQRHRPAGGGLADDIANHRTRSQFRSRTVYMRRHRPTRRRHPPTSASETELTTRVGVRRAWPLPLRLQQASPSVPASNSRRASGGRSRQRPATRLYHEPARRVRQQAGLSRCCQAFSVAKVAASPVSRTPNPATNRRFATVGTGPHTTTQVADLP